MSGCVCADIWAGELNLSPECIGRLWIFDRLTTDELKVIGALAMRKLYHPGESIFHQGDPAKTMFLIKGGRVRLDKFMEDGSEIFLDIRKSGDFIGEYMLNDHFPMTHEDLSFLVGAHRVSITRAMKALKSSGRITQQGKTMVIHFA